MMTRRASKLVGEKSQPKTSPTLGSNSGINTRSKSRNTKQSKAESESENESDSNMDLDSDNKSNNKNNKNNKSSTSPSIRTRSTVTAVGTKKRVRENDSEDESQKQKSSKNAELSEDEEDENGSISLNSEDSYDSDSENENKNSKSKKTITRPRSQIKPNNKINNRTAKKPPAQVKSSNNRKTTPPSRNNKNLKNKKNKSYSDSEDSDFESEASDDYENSEDESDKMSVESNDNIDSGDAAEENEGIPIEEDIEDPVQKISKILACRAFRGQFLSLPYILNEYLYKLPKHSEHSPSITTPPSTTSTSTDKDMKDIDENDKIIKEQQKQEDHNNITTTTTTTNTTPNVPTDNFEIRYLVLLKNKSYRSIRWIAQKEIEKERLNSTNTSLNQMLKKSTPLKPDPIESENDANPINYFEKDYIIIEKVLSRERKQPVRSKPAQTYYLIKWKGLPYEKSTWELESILLQREEDRAKIEQYNDFESNLPDKKHIPRPSKIPLKFERTLVPKFKESLKLKEFQVEGFLWLCYSWYHQRSSLLADEMGLGKTIQTIAFVQYLSQSVGIKGPFMIVAPLSTIGNWNKEIQKWTDMKVLVFYGSQESRGVIVKYEWQRKDKSYQFEILLTTYETIMAEHNLLARVNWRLIVLDEGHRIKNVNSKVLQRLRSLRVEHSIILTGTPLQNDMKELWTMLNFLAPDSFDNCNEFLTEFSDLKELTQVQKLHQLLVPYLLRRMKEDVELSIPVKEETVIQVELSSIQKTFYRAILEKNREFLARGIKSKSNLPKLTNIMIQIRKVCNHPFLIPGAEDTISKQEKVKTDDQLGDLLVRASSKLVLVDKLLARLKQEGHQVLIFSQMVESLNILEDYLQFREYTYERLDGGIKSEVRQQSIERFADKEANRFVFLLSTRAGGVGINLTTADTVILFDSDWNPQSDLQAQARCHRIGQTSNVKVYRLITRNTYEEYLFEVATKKLLLDHIVLNSNKKADLGENNNNNNKEGQTDELGIPITNATSLIGGKEEDTESPNHISQMLKYGAAYLFNESTDVDHDKVMINEDIDKILERSTTISFDDKSKPTNLSGFSKATFSASISDMSVDIDDENFWEKILPDYKTVKQLEEKFNNGTIFSTEELRSKFIEDIITLAQSKKDDQVDSISIEFIGDLVKLLLKIEFNTRFSETERERLTQTRMLLEKPRTRKRVVPEIIYNNQPTEKKKGKTTNISVLESDSSSDNDSDPDYVMENEDDDSDNVETVDGQKKSLKKSGNSINNRGSMGTTSNPNGTIPLGSNQLTPVWTKTQKDKLKASLFKYGPHRWKKLSKESGIGIRTPQEIQSVSEAFLEIGHKHQSNLMKDYFDSFIEDTSNFSLLNLGLNIDSKVQIDSTNNIGKKKFNINDNFPSTNYFSTQTLTLNWSCKGNFEKETNNVKLEDPKDQNEKKEYINGDTPKKDDGNIATDKESEQKETKLETKDEIKDETKPETKDDIKDETKPEIKLETKDETKLETKDETKLETKLETKDETKLETKLENKDEIKDETKTTPEIKPEIKSDTTSETKPEINSETNDEMNVDSNPKQNNETTPNISTTTSTKQDEPKTESSTVSSIGSLKYYLIFSNEDFKDHHIIRSYHLTQDQGSLDIILPGLSGTYNINIVDVDVEKNTVINCSNTVKIILTPNLVWQPSDFPSFTTRVQTILTRLVQMRSIKRLVTRYGKKLDKLKLPIINRGPFPTWTPENDKSLLLGIYKHGYGKYQEIFSDPELDLIKKTIGTTNTGPNQSTSPPQISSPNQPHSDDFQNPDTTTSTTTTTSDANKIPSSESLRRRVQKVTESIHKMEINEKVTKQQFEYLQHQQHLQQQIHQQHLHHLQQKHQDPFELSDEEDEKKQFPNPVNPMNKSNNNHKPLSLPPPNPPQQKPKSVITNNYNNKPNIPTNNNNFPHQQNLPSFEKMGIDKYMNINQQHQQKHHPSIQQKVQITIILKWESKYYKTQVPSSFSIEQLRRVFVLKNNLQDQYGQNGDDKENIFRFFYLENEIPPNTKLADIPGLSEEDQYLVISWESKWKTIEVQGFDSDPVFMKVQDDTLLEDIVKTYFVNSQPPYDYKNLGVEVNGKALELNLDIGANGISNKSLLKIVPSQDIIQISVVPNWPGADTEIYALHKKSTLLLKLIENFLDKHNLQQKQVDFITNRRQIVDGNKTPSEVGISKNCDIFAILRSVKVDVTFQSTNVPYFLSTTTSFDSLMERFCDKMQIPKHKTQFIYDGKLLHNDDTPDKIKMSPIASIICQLVQPPNNNVNNDIIEVEVRLVGKDAGSLIKMNSKNEIPLQILMDKFCQEHHLSKARSHFTYKGLKLNDSDTSTSVGLKHGDIIECRYKD